MERVGGGKTGEEKVEEGGMDDRFPDKGETFSKGWNEIGLDPRHRYRWWEVRSGSECTCRESRLITHS